MQQQPAQLRSPRFLLTFSNRSRTRLAPTPTNSSTNSEAAQEKKGVPASPATALASSVLPVPVCHKKSSMQQRRTGKAVVSSLESAGLSSMHALGKVRVSLHLHPQHRTKLAAGPSAQQSWKGPAASLSCVECAGVSVCMNLQACCHTPTHSPSTQPPRTRSSTRCTAVLWTPPQKLSFGLCHRIWTWTAWGSLQ